MLTGKLISLAIIIASVPVGIISYYIMSPLAKGEKKQYIEELSSQIINFVIFIWAAKIILNLPLFITDPIGILTYPSNSQAFYLAILFSVLLLLYKGVKKKINMLAFIESGVLVFLVTSFTLMNFIIRIFRYITKTCSYVEPFVATCFSDVADFSNYEIHSPMSLFKLL